MSQFRALLLLSVFAACTAWAPRASGQCMLANPSFEHPGSAGSTFGGWNQFGSIGSTTRAVHGAVGALVSGPNTHNWDVSAYWQSFSASAGQRFNASVWVLNPSTRPLTGACQAILNIEWRDSGGNLISYESHAVATATTPRDTFKLATVTSLAAPAGTASTRLLLGVLQSPTDPIPDVIYDQAMFANIGPPTLDQVQWSDFPGAKTLSFSGRTWRVKGPGYYGPGPNLFSDAASNVWADGSGKLHLTIKKSGNSWYSTEVVLQDTLGYGDYVFTTRGRLDTLDIHTVLGLFLWEYGSCYDPAYLWWNPYNEIDVEFSRWGNSGNAVAQFVAQPYDTPGNIHRFDETFSDGEVTSHAFRWLPDRVEYRSWRGGPGAESAGTLVQSWTYTGADIPRPEQTRIHLNLWQFNAPPATTQEVVMDAFTFIPRCVGPSCGAVGVGPPAPVPPGSMTVHPNPFTSSTTLRYALARPRQAEVAVFDIAGRRIRTLFQGFQPAGEHEAHWDGRDQTGHAVAAGVYLCRFTTGNSAEIRRVVLVR